MKKFVYILLLSVLFCPMIQGQALSEQDYATMKESLLKNASQLKSIKADFKQVKRMSFLEAEIVSSGLFFFKAPHHLRWQYVQPFNYTVVIDDQHIAIDDEGKKSVFDAGSSEGFKALNKLLVSTVNGDFFSTDQFDVSAFYAGEQYRLKLVPKSKDVLHNVSELEVLLSPADWGVQEVKMIEPSGDFTLIVFTNQIYNSDIAQNLFSTDI